MEPMGGLDVGVGDVDAPLVDHNQRGNEAEEKVSEAKYHITERFHITS
jgi:hypothetical protein